MKRLSKIKILKRNFRPLEGYILYILAGLEVWLAYQEKQTNKPCSNLTEWLFFKKWNKGFWKKTCVSSSLCHVSSYTNMSVKVISIPRTYCEANTIAAVGMFSHFGRSCSSTGKIDGHWIMMLCGHTLVIRRSISLKQAKQWIKWFESVTYMLLKMFN